MGLALGAISSPISGAAIYSLGHGDIRFHFSGTALYQRVHVDPESTVDGVEVGNAPDGVEYLTGEVTMLVPERTLPRPNGPEWAFIGNDPGEPVWFIPEVQEFDRPWLGVSTAELDPGDWTNFRLRLIHMDGPAGGQFSLSDSSGLFFAHVFFATSDGIDAADQFEPILGSHAHYSWLFTKPGTYNVTLEVSGQHVSAGSVSSLATYQFDVIPEPSLAALVLMAAGFSVFRRHRQKSPSIHCKEDPVI